MFICAMDIGRFLLKMVLTVKDPMPLFLEGQRFKIPVESASILNQLQMWADFYEEAPVLVCCTQDIWPVHFTESLRSAGYRINWVEQKNIRKLMKVWRSICPDSRWLRAGLMSYLYAPENSGSSSSDISRLTVLEWMYASLRSQITDLEGALFAEGQSLCPGHLSAKCPLCEGDDEFVSEDSCSEGGAALQ